MTGEELIKLIKEHNLQDKQITTRLTRLNYEMCEPPSMSLDFIVRNVKFDGDDAEIFGSIYLETGEYREY